jgi:hypothetical protein
MRNKLLAGAIAAVLAAGLTGAGSVGAVNGTTSAVEPTGDPPSPACADFNGGDSSYQLAFNGFGLPFALVVTAPVSTEAPTCKGVHYSMHVLGLPKGTVFPSGPGPAPSQFTVPLGSAGFDGDGTTGTANPINFTLALQGPVAPASGCPTPSGPGSAPLTTQILSATTCVDSTATPSPDGLNPGNDQNSAPQWICVFVRSSTTTADDAGTIDRAPTRGCFVTQLDPSSGGGRGFN